MPRLQLIARAQLHRPLLLFLCRLGHCTVSASSFQDTAGRGVAIFQIRLLDWMILAQ